MTTIEAGAGDFEDENNSVLMTEEAKKKRQKEYNKLFNEPSARNSQIIEADE